MAKIQALLINEEQLRLYSPVSGTFDWDLITPHVITAQDRDIQPILGQRLFQRLLDGVHNNDLNEAESNLLEDYVQKALAHSTMYHAYPFLSSKLIQSTLTKIEIENGIAVDQIDANELSRLVKKSSEFYNERLINHLTYNADLYPQYTEDAEGEIEPSRDKTYTFGINLTGGKGGKSGEVVTSPKVTSHNELSDRNAANSHPISAITGLSDDLTAKAEDIEQAKTDIEQAQADITQAQADITQLETDLGQVETDLTQAEADIVKNAEDITFASDTLGDAILANKEAIAALSGASIKLNSPALIGQTIPTVETVWDFDVETPSNETDLLDANDTTNSVFFKNSGIRYIFQTYLIVKTLNSPDKTITLRTKNKADDSILTERVINIEGKENFISYLPLPVLIVDNVIDNLEFYITLEASDNEIEVLNVDSIINTNAAINTGGGEIVIPNVTWASLVSNSTKKAGDRFNVTDREYGYITLESANTFLYTDTDNLIQQVIIE